MSIDKVSNQMEITEKALNYTVKRTEIDVEVKLHINCQSFLQYFSHERITLWLPQDIISKYKLKVDGIVWKFQTLLVLSDIDHNPLISCLRGELNSLLFLVIAYSEQNQYKIIKKQLKQIQEQLSSPPLFKDSQKQKMVLLLVKQNKKETITSRLSRLKQVVSQKLFYPMDQYLSKTKLFSEEYIPFLKGLILHYQDILKKFLVNRIKKIGLEDQIVIKRIRILSQKDEDDIKITKFKTGLIIEVKGFQECFGKLYQIFERWIQKLNWIVAEVERIECCSKESLVQWFEANYQQSIYPLSLRQNAHRVVIFSPKKQRQYFEKILRIATRIVTAKQFQQNFSCIFKYKNEFKKYIASQKIGETKLRFYPNFILFEGDPNVQQKMRRKIKDFIESYSQQKVQIEEFKSNFHISLLKHFYGKTIKINPITLQINNGKLYRCNPKKNSELLAKEIKEIYQLMFKEIVSKPLSKLLPKKLDYFQVTQVPSYCRTTQWLQSKRFKIRDKITINLRSYGTLINGTSSCIFFVSDFEKCNELRQILQQEGGISKNFLTNLKKNMILTMPLRFCKYFSKIHICYWEGKRGRYGSQNKNMEIKITQFVQGLVDDPDNIKQLQIMFPRQYQQVDYILPKFLQNMLLSVKYNPGLKKDLTLYTSCVEGDKIRKNITDFLRHFKFEGENKVERITDLDLKIPQMQKIIEYKYFELKYFDNNITKSGTPLNSYIFQQQFKKQMKTPIFLQTRGELKNLRYKEYLVSCFDWEVYEVRQNEVMKLRNRCQHYEGLYKLCLLVKKYFPYIDFLVLYGDTQRDVYSQKFAYTDSSQKLYKRFQKVKIEKKEQKILVLNNMQPIQYQMITNNHLKLYKVETHPQLLQQLHQLKKCVSLQ